MDPACRQLAATWLGRLAWQLDEELTGIRKARDVECVHRARVASRRLRALLNLLDDEFPPKQLPRWKKVLRRLTQALGDARDKDVHIEFLAGQLAKLSKRSRCHGVAVLLADFEHQRADCQPETLKQIRRFRRKGCIQQMLDTSEGMLSNRLVRDANPLSRPLLERARAAMEERLDELFQWAPSLADPKAQKGHHAMRIAAKRLRYTLELIAPACSGRLDRTFETVKQLQALLGDIHDCDVWIDELAAFNKAQREWIKESYGRTGPHGRIAKGLKHLRRVCRDRRDATFRKLVRFWSTLPDRKDWLPEVLDLPEQKEVYGQDDDEPAISQRAR
ncbi:MAG: CHAD domain-containing protein [Pirellulales bacterium]|nr:CHAD domain-containing protein [Pirellulales bacterium]